MRVWLRGLFSTPTPLFQVGKAPLRDWGSWYRFPWVRRAWDSGLIASSSKDFSVLKIKYRKFEGSVIASIDSRVLLYGLGIAPAVLQGVWQTLSARLVAFGIFTPVDWPWWSLSRIIAITSTTAQRMTSNLGRGLQVRQVHRPSPNA